MAVLYSKNTSITLANGASGNTDFVACDGATKVNIAVTADVTHQLTTGSVRLLMSDGKIVTIAPAALPGGTDGTTVEINCAGVVTGADLSGSTHRSITVRNLVGSGTSGPYAIASDLSGVRAVGLALTKAGTPGDAVYTVKTTVYGNPK